MENQKIVYFILILVVFILLSLGYYLFFYSKEIIEDTENQIINNEDIISGIQTIRSNPFLIHGVVDSVEKKNENEIVLNVNINMIENFESSPFRLATKSFLLNNDSIVNTSEKDEGQEVISIKEEFSERVDDFSVLSEGDLVLINTGESLSGILDKNIFTVVEIWKILEK